MTQSPQIAALIDSVTRDMDNFNNVLGCRHLARHIAAQEVSRAAMISHVEGLERQRRVMQGAQEAGIANPQDRKAVEHAVDTLKAEVEAYRKAIATPGYIEALAKQQNQYDSIIKRLEGIDTKADNDGALNSVARQSVDMATHMSNIGSLLCKLSVEIEARGASDMQAIHNIIGEVKSMRGVIREGWINMFNDIEQLDNEGWNV